ncbi:MAG: translocation/assembly module TamB [Bacteroidales bacterium]|jgi:hypothetical protein|nr:translocation/assembly module TamB [Bacteroidales bacterium]
MILLSVLSIPTVIVLVINSEWFQNKITEKVTVWLSEELNNSITIEHVQFSSFNRLTLKNLNVTDLNGDVILHAPELIARLNFLSFTSHKIALRSVQLNGASIHLAYDPNRDDINLKFIIDKLKSKDTTDLQAKWNFIINSIKLNDCYFSFCNPSKTFDRPFGMDYASLSIARLNLHVTDFRLGGPPDYGVLFRIENLSCEEQCGLNIHSLSADFTVNRHNLSFRNVQFTTNGSQVKANDVSFNFDSFQDFSDGKFISKVKMSIDVVASSIVIDELSSFTPVFKDYRDHACISGKISGTVDNMKGEDVRFSSGSMTEIDCSFDLKGLPEVRSTFIYANFNHLRTCPADVEQIHSKHSQTGFVRLPKAMYELTEINFRGNFTGFFDDFVTYGTFDTNLGNLSTDLSFKPVMTSKIDTSFTFHGMLKTNDFHLGELLNTSSIGKLTMKGKVNGMASGPDKISADIEGLINKILLKGYVYKDIDINGTINNRTYDGQLKIDEPNVKIDFSGKVDMTNPNIPQFNFHANVDRAHLYRLNLSSDTTSFLSFNITADFSGTNIDNIMGDLNLKNSLIRRHNHELEINDLLVFTKAIRDTNRFVLRSDIFNAEVWGQYQFLKLPESFIALVKNYAPSWGLSSIQPETTSGNSFRFEAEFVNTEKLTNFFLDEFYVAKGTRIEGIYNPSQKDVRFVLNVPRMSLNGKRWQGFYANGVCEESAFLIEIGCRAFRLNNNMTFENLTILTDTHSDSTLIDVRWNNWDSILNKGNLRSAIVFNRQDEKTVPAINISSSPGQIYTSGYKWDLSHEGVTIDSSMIKIKNLLLNRNEQEIKISGLISQRNEDKLTVNVKDLDISTVNAVLRSKNFALGGTANGKILLSDLFEVPIVTSNMHVDSFSINNEVFGNTDLSAIWNSSSKKVNIKTESVRDHLQTLFINGNYNTDDETLDFNAQLQKISASIFQPYVEDLFTHLEGELSGELKLTGTLSKPLINGEIKFQTTSLTVDYTKTRYHFSGILNVSDNIFNIKNISIFDRFENPGKMNGSIAVENLRDLKLDLNFNVNHFEILNTTIKDNSFFYGKGFASGNMQIKGHPNKMDIKIYAKTEKNTQFFIPINSDDEAEQTSFITFVDHTPRSQKKLYNFRRRRVATTNNDEQEQTLNINLNLDVTPSAEVQLVFDSKIGDVMKAKGAGNLVFNIGNNHFDMFGSYIIEHGDYLFTLRNVINKKFVIDKGGMITWNGDPLDALLNLKAKYTTKAPLSDLMGTTKESNSRNSVPVECLLYITNTFTDPNIRFEINMPTAHQEVRSFLNAATNTDEEMTKQFLWLMVMGRFYVDPSIASQNNDNANNSLNVENMAMTTVSEVMSNQLSHMLSQWSNNLDVDVNYHPGFGADGQNFGMNLSTDKWSFSMDYEIGGMRAVETSSNIVSDFTFEYKLIPSGKLKFKAFNRSNEQYFIQSPYTQGIGLLFREDFNRFGDLFYRKEDAKTIVVENDEKKDKDGEKKDDEKKTNQ